MNEQEWIEKPEALGLLVQQTVRHLIQQRPDRSEQEAQLREVSRTVERLEKMGLSVPEELRRLKTNLVVQTDQDTDFDRQLRTLGESLVEALGMIKSVISKPRLKGSIQKESTPRPLVIMLGLLALRFRASDYPHIAMKHINLLILLDFFVTHQILVVMENQHVAELWVIGWLQGCQAPVQA